MENQLVEFAGLPDNTDPKKKLESNPINIRNNIKPIPDFVNLDKNTYLDNIKNIYDNLKNTMEKPDRSKYIKIFENPENIILDLKNSDIYNFALDIIKKI